MKVNKRYRQGKFNRPEYKEVADKFRYVLEDGANFEITKRSTEAYCAVLLNGKSIKGKFQTLQKRLPDEAFGYLSNFMEFREMYDVPEFEGVSRIMKDSNGGICVVLDKQSFTFVNRGRIADMVLSPCNMSNPTTAADACITSGTEKGWKQVKKGLAKESEIEVTLHMLYELLYG